METQPPRLLYYKDDNGQVEIQVYRHHIMVHSEIVNWKPSVIRQAYKVFHTLMEEAASMGIYILLTCTPNPRFAKLFGGEVVNRLLYNDIEHEVIKWELD